ncbi:low temperature requirement protein A [Micromonospora sp. C31]|uniref:low temperature requirement protein A n=1 Tax=Micromonospora sp. C31 TaxID=2824876 RepID=UPI001B396797|nr:low temperature requirement protein A [Micromonospora sp. C31]MBQ1072675.1 low temperature requirement protein A [Micromonospora sp. C31]
MQRGNGGPETGGLLRGPEQSRQANFLELFFDLVLVFALKGVVDRVTPDLLSDDLVIRWASLLYALVLALPLLWLWTTTAHITSRFDPRHQGIQVMVLVSAFGLLLMTTSLQDAFIGRGLVFAVPYVLLQVGRPLILAALVRGRVPLQVLYLRMAAWSGVSGVLWVGGGIAQDEGRVLLWSLAITLDFLGARVGWLVPRIRHRSISAWAMHGGHHLAERYQQLLLIALGESVLSVGSTYTVRPAGAANTLGLVVAFITTILLWRIYFYRSGQVLAEAVTMARNREGLGRRTGAAHMVMVIGILTVAIGHEVVQERAGSTQLPVWLMTILGGPALFLLGRIRLERIVFDRVSTPRIVGVVLLLALSPPLVFTTPLAAAATASLVLLGIAIADARRAAKAPEEAPTPPG